MRNALMYTNAQLVILEACSVVTGFISLVSSLTVISFQLKRRKHRLKHMYERIILGSSIVDVIVSAAFAFLGVWAVPREVDFVLGARGSFATCSLLGFMINFGFGSVLYNAFLSVFFVLVVVCGFPERSMSYCFEPFMHLIAFAAPLASGIYALSIDAMNPIEGLPGNCWVNEYPPDCVTQEEMDAIMERRTVGDGLEVKDDFSSPELCVRGEGFEIVALFCGPVLMGFSILVVVVSMVCIILKVYKTEKRLRAYMFFDTQVVGNVGCTGPDLLRTRQACWKALLYIGSIVMSCFGIVCYQFVSMQDLEESETRGLHFTFALCSKFLTPLYGFWQYLIYFRYTSSDKVTNVVPQTMKSEMKSAFFLTPGNLNIAEDSKLECLDPSDEQAGLPEGSMNDCLEIPPFEEQEENDNAMTFHATEVLENEEERKNLSIKDVISITPETAGSTELSGSDIVLNVEHQKSEEERDNTIPRV